MKGWVAPTLYCYLSQQVKEVQNKDNSGVHHETWKYILNAEITDLLKHANTAEIHSHTNILHKNYKECSKTSSSTEKQTAHNL